MSPRGQELWRWPLWSWKHLAITCAMLAVVLIGLGRLQARGEEESRAPRPTLTPTASVKADVEVVPSATSEISASPGPSGSVSTSSAPSLNSPIEVARAFVIAWARPYDPASEWRARLTPLSAPQLVAQLAKTDPLRVPATAVVGDGVEVAKSATSMTVRHTTDNGHVLVTLVRSGPHWLVASIARDESTGGVP